MSEAPTVNFLWHYGFERTVIAELLILTTLDLLTVSLKPLSSHTYVGTWCYLASEFFPLSSISEPNEAELS